MSEVKETKRYVERVKPRLEEIRAWARDGLTEEEIAKNLKIALSTFKEYKNKFSAVSAALKSARAYDDEVVYALHRNTLGGIVKLKKPIKCKKRYYEGGRLVREEEVIETAEEEIYVTPDTMAQMYWLNNRQKQKWKSKPIENEADEQERAEREERDESVLSALKERKVMGFVYEDGVQRQSP
ncbi:MAG: transposase [Clostridia bacterium]|nr:transposase [Clostridia bacterium]